jgi:hypothetical protein
MNNGCVAGIGAALEYPKALERPVATGNLPDGVGRRHQGAVRRWEVVGGKGARDGRGCALAGKMGRGHLQGIRGMAAV